MKSAPGPAAFGFEVMVAGMLKSFYFISGLISVAFGLVGIALPLLPTVPFLILAAFCFARSSPPLEARLRHHRVYGPHIRLWQDHGAITRKGKWAATIGFAFSIPMAFYLVPMPWPLVSLAAALIAGIWIWRRPEC